MKLFWRKQQRWALRKTKGDGGHFQRPPSPEEDRLHIEEWRVLWRFLKPRRKLLILIGLLGVAHIVVRLSPSFGSVLVFDYALRDRALILGSYVISPIQLFILAAIAIFGMTVSEMALIYWQRLLSAESGEGTIRDLREASYEKLLRLPVSFFQVRNSGKMIMRFIGDMSAVSWLAEGGLVAALLDIGTLCIVVMIFFWLDPLLALAALLLFPVFLWALWRALQPLQAERRNVRRARIEMAGRLQEQFLNAEAMRLFLKPDRLRRQFRRLNQQVYTGNINLARRGGWLESLSVSVSSFTSGVILLFGAWLALHNVLTVGELFAFYYLSLFIIPIFRRLALFDQEYAQAMVAMERVVFLLNQEEIPDIPSDNPIATRPTFSIKEGRITVCELDFAHTQKRGFVFRNLNLECPPACITAVVGPAGVGKSTLALLLAGQLTPTAGSIRIDGQNVHSVLNRWPSSHAVALVEQHVELFADTLLANICIGWDWKGEGLSKSERNLRIETMAHLIGANTFIDALPKGYRTQAGQRGVRLSARQRALVGLLRALVGLPAILLVDGAENFNASQALASLRTFLHLPVENLPSSWLKTVVLFTSVPSVALAADRVILLDYGGVMESGDPRELLCNSKSAFVSYLRQHQWDFNSFRSEQAALHQVKLI